MLSEATIITGNKIRCNRVVVCQLPNGAIQKLLDNSMILTVKDVYMTDINITDGEETINEIVFTVEELPNPISVSLRGLEDAFPITEDVLVDYFYGVIDQDKEQ